MICGFLGLLLLVSVLLQKKPSLAYFTSRKELYPELPHFEMFISSLYISGCLRLSI